MNPAKSPGEGESLNGEIFVGIRPRSGRHPAEPARERGEGFNAVFVAVFGVDGLAGAKVDGFAGDFHLLPLQACKMHLDAMPLAIIERMMFEHVETESAAKLAIDARKQIEIELGGDARGI